MKMLAAVRAGYSVVRLGVERAWLPASTIGRSFCSRDSKQKTGCVLP